MKQTFQVQNVKCGGCANTLKKALKDDFADLLSLAEEDATSRKLFKKECVGIELVDIEISNTK